MNEPARAFPGASRAVVIGGGLTGMLAAQALSGFVSDVIVLEHDYLPARPAPRKGLPQAHHGHLFYSGGVNAMEIIVNGVTDRLLRAGARRIPLPTGMLAYSPEGWYRRWPATHFLLACSRDLIDFTVRELVAAEPNIHILQGVTAVGLDGTERRVSGVRVSDGQDEGVLDAQVVVDTSGRGSRAPQWLRDLGVGPVPERTVDTGLAYASRIYQAPADSEEFPVVTVMADPLAHGPGQSAAIIPIEGGRWLVSLAGTRGGEPTDDPLRFEAFAGGLRHPLVGQLISPAVPLTDVVVTRSTGNRRRYFEKVKTWPEGFVAVGDTVATYNPVYGQGMSVAAKSVLAMLQELCCGGARIDGFAQRAQRAVAKPVHTAWSLATAQDVLYTGAGRQSSGRAARLRARYSSRLARAATGSHHVTTALTDVMTLQSDVTTLVRPYMMLAALRKPLLPPLTAPPLTRSERRLLTSPEIPGRQSV
ncbi:pyridine nucleotide-disulfide oxidoreductase [Streptomyces sp. NPDC005407]|uniref:NAD(P)/FAD-dependent oxidoreductase n=1 Tax=Streptomyces sp. NPDC005407 TaxID=3155340 RepID=UPI0033A5D705